MGVAGHVEGMEGMVLRGFRVVEDRPQLREVSGAEEVRHVADRRRRERREERRLEEQHAVAAEGFGRDLAVEPTAPPRVAPLREHPLQAELGPPHTLLYPFPACPPPTP